LRPKKAADSCFVDVALSLNWPRTPRRAGPICFAAEAGLPGTKKVDLRSLCGLASRANDAIER
jgi:hypothetical protein